jgi:hypothetical protein
MRQAIDTRHGLAQVLVANADERLLVLWLGDE